MRHYCTLFDKNYLAKGLAMLDSLKRHSAQPYAMHILAMDYETGDALETLGYADDVDTIHTVETFREFSYFPPRPWAEFCWTMASQFTEYLLNMWDHDPVIYLDADLFFFSDPKVVHDEIGDRSIGIIPHRLIPSKQYLEVNGKFNVGWVSFRNTETGRACLSRWAAQVRERCDASTCGDQKYLDEWPSLYGDEVCIIQNIGANVAPWNLGNYEVSTNFYRNAPWGMDTEPTVNKSRIIFYHFHEYEHGKRLTNYELRPEDIDFIYKPYIKAINEAQLLIAGIHA